MASHSSLASGVGPCVVAFNNGGFRCCSLCSARLEVSLASLHRDGCDCRATCDSALFAFRSPAATRMLPQIANATPIAR